MLQALIWMEKIQVNILLKFYYINIVIIFKYNFLDSGERKSSTSPGIQLLAGYCSRLGPRSSNEDRCISLIDLFHEVNKFMSSPKGPNHIPFYGDDRGPNWRDFSPRQRTCGPSSHKDAYFAVYDGHSGSIAANFLNNVLHHSIYT